MSFMQMLKLSYLCLFICLHVALLFASVYELCNADRYIARIIIIIVCVCENTP